MTGLAVKRLAQGAVSRRRRVFWSGAALGAGEFGGVGGVHSR